MEIPRHWRLKRERLNFEVGHQCGMCGELFTQDRPVCPSCGLHFESGHFLGQRGEEFLTLLASMVVLMEASLAYEIKMAVSEIASIES